MLIKENNFTLTNEYITYIFYMHDIHTLQLFRSYIDHLYHINFVLLKMAIFDVFSVQRLFSKLKTKTNRFEKDKNLYIGFTIVES